ncbi:unnamed protein product [Lampetra fluviatilis]
MVTPSGVHEKSQTNTSREIRDDSGKSLASISHDDCGHNPLDRIRTQTVADATVVTQNRRSTERSNDLTLESSHGKEA